MTRPPRRRRNAALSRGRLRILLFLILACAAVALGEYAALALCTFGLLCGFVSVGVARARGDDLAHSFAVLDWLVFGCVLAASGGTASWLLPAVPLLAVGQLAAAPRQDWPYLLAPSLLLAIVLAIADPSLGGSRLLGVLKLAVLVTGGVVAASRLHRARPSRRAAPKVDVLTGMYAASRLEPILADQMAAALREHRPLGVVHARLEHFEDARNFLGPEGSDDLVRSVSRRLERLLPTDGIAFRVSPDAFVAVLPGLSLSETLDLAEQVAHEIGADLIGGRRQTVATGVSTFPAVRDLHALLAAAREGAAAEAVPRATPRGAPARRRPVRRRARLVTPCGPR